MKLIKIYQSSWFMGNLLIFEKLIKIKIILFVNVNKKKYINF
jgi:hypothetical protein